MKKIFTVLFVLLVVFSNVFGFVKFYDVKVNAAVIPNIVDSIKTTNIQNGSTISTNRSAKITFNWSQKSSEIKSGDIFTIKAPNNLEFSAKTIDLVDDNGVIIGSGVITKSGFTATFNSEIEKKTNWKGSVTFIGKFTGYYSSEQKVNVDYLINDNYTLTNQLDYKPMQEVSLAGRQLNKNGVGLDNPVKDTKITWTVISNQPKDIINGAILTDTIGAGHEFVQGSVKVYQREFDNYLYPITDRITVDPSKYTVSMTNSKLSVELGDINTSYIVVYQTKITDPFYFDGYKNSVNLSGSSYSQTRNTKARFYVGGNEVSGIGVTAVKIIKKSEEGNLLQGAEFGVFEKDGTFVKNGVTNEYGEVIFDKMKFGEYYYQELRAPEGYVLNSEKVPFTIQTTGSAEMGGNIVLDAVNKRIKGSLEILKVDEDNNNLVLKDAEFTLYDNEGKEVGKGNTSDNGKVLFVDLPYGKYTFKETLSPEGYLLNSEEFAFEIDKSGQVVKFEVKDKKKDVPKVEVKEPNQPMLPQTGEVVDESKDYINVKIFGFVVILLLLAFGIWFFIGKLSIDEN